MLYFYLKMHQNAFGGRALPGPAEGTYSAPHALAGLKGDGREGGGRGKEGKGEWGRTPNVWSALTPLLRIRRNKNLPAFYRQQWLQTNTFRLLQLSQKCRPIIRVQTQCNQQWQSRKTLRNKAAEMPQPTATGNETLYKNILWGSIPRKSGPTFSTVPRKILRRFHILGKSQERRHFRKDLRKDLRKIFGKALTLTQEINVRNNNERRILYVLCVVVIFDVI